MFGSLLNFKKKKAPDSSLRSNAQAYIDSSDTTVEDDTITEHERALLENILKLRDESVINVMVPRADIVAVDIDTPLPQLLTTLADHQFSRLPVYEGNLDHVLGSLHIKDILAAISENKEIDIRDHLTHIPVISPSMPILDLILEMKQNRRHMALVVDEYGGIDGLVTLSDIIEEIVGEVEDEHDNDDDEPQISREEDGAIIADARIYVEDFEAEYGPHFSQTERDESETLGGLVFSLAGRIPHRGEVLTHRSGMTFEILDADPRRVHRLRIRDVSPST